MIIQGLSCANADGYEILSSDTSIQGSAAKVVMHSQRSFLFVVRVHILLLMQVRWWISVLSNIMHNQQEGE